MNIDYSHFWLQKSDNIASEYEDAYFPLDSTFEISPPNKKFERYVIADGASTAYLSGLWATILVEAFGSYEGEITNANFFEIFQTLILEKYWNPRLMDYIKKREDEGNPLLWYDERALQNGADSTLLAISFFFDERKLNDYFSALAIGDSCLFQVRDDELVATFPLNCSADFDNSPLLISSDPKRNLNIQEKIECRDNQSIIVGDLIFLMTDALASWFFQEHERGDKPWEIIREFVMDQSSFIDWIELLRQNKKIRDDDVTLMILKIRED